MEALGELEEIDQYGERSYTEEGKMKYKEEARKGFLNLLLWLRRVILQDAVLFFLDNSLNSALRDPVFSTPEFELFKTDLLACMAEGQPPRRQGPFAVEASAPDEPFQMKNKVGSTSQAHQEERLEAVELPEEHSDVVQSMDQDEKIWATTEKLSQTNDEAGSSQRVQSQSEERSPRGGEVRLEAERTAKGPSARVLQNMEQEDEVIDDDVQNQLVQKLVKEVGAQQQHVDHLVEKVKTQSQRTQELLRVVQKHNRNRLAELKRIGQQHEKEKTLLKEQQEKDKAALDSQSREITRLRKELDMLRGISK
ncbi:hypothetical protein CPB97_006834 [Podila verticillata]|nr:hypothetical protein CPB97_006834 [Podila verticillata]